MSLATDLRTQLVQLSEDAKQRLATAHSRGDQRTVLIQAGRLDAFKTMIETVELAAELEPIAPLMGRPPKRMAS